MGSSTKPKSMPTRSTSSTSLPTSSRRGGRDATAHKPLQPFTVDHFRRYTGLLVLDTEKPWVLEDFQADIVGEFFRDFTAVWLVIPEGNAKTTLTAGITLYFADYTPLAKVLVAASTREQAETMHTQAADIVRRSRLLKRFKPLDGHRRIKALRTGGRIQVKAAQDAANDGAIYDLAIIDELHRAKDLKLYRTWLGKSEKLGGVVGVLSTAGEPGSEFEDTRAQIIRTADSVVTTGFHRRAVNGHTVLHDYAVPAKVDIDDMAMVKRANPLSKITEASLRTKRDGPEMTVEHWKRFSCNQPTIVDGGGITGDEWDALAEPDLQPSADLEGFGWLDLGWRIDTSAVGVILWESDERRLVPAPVILEPPVDEGDIVAAILDFAQRFPNLRGWVMDPNAGAQQMAQLLEKGTHPLQVERHAPPVVFVEHSQDNAPMSLAASRLDEAMRGGWIVHTGDRKFRTHVLNAVRRSTGGEKHKYDRPAGAQGGKRARYPIDALTGLLIGHSVAVAELGEGAAPAFDLADYRITQV